MSKRVSKMQCPFCGSPVGDFYDLMPHMTIWHRLTNPKTWLREYDTFPASELSKHEGKDDVTNP